MSKINIAGWCIKNNQTAIILYAIVMLMGVSTFFSIGRSDNPDIPIRAAQITTPYNGRDAIQVEQEVTELIEQELRAIPEFEKVQSTSKRGLSIITPEVNIRYFDELSEIWRRTRNHVNDIASKLPSGASEPIVNDEFGDVFGLIIALTGDGFSYRELKEYAEDIQDEMLLLKDVGKVELFGIQEERVFLEYSDTLLAELGLSPFELSSLLEAENAITSSGDVKIGPYRSLIRTLGEFSSEEEIQQTTLQVPGQSTSFQVSDVSQVRRDYIDPPELLTHFNDKPAIFIAINMSAGGIITELGELVKQRMKELQSELPWGLELNTAYMESEYAEKSISDFMVNLGQAFFFVVLVMYLFAGIRIALVVGVLVPSAVLMCISMLPSVDVELQTISIAAFIIALGILVDNAVVVSERILVRLGEGEERFAAVTGAISELWMPLLASSLTTIFAFLPIATAESDVGTFCYSLFAVVALTLISSWIMSLTIIPLFCYYFLQPLKEETRVGTALIRFIPKYEQFLEHWLKQPVKFGFIIIGLFVISLWGFQFVPQNFFPPNERNMFTVELNLPYGTKIETTAEAAAKFERYLLTEKKDQIKSVSTFTGAGGPRWNLSWSPEPPNPNYAFLLVITESSESDIVDTILADARQYVKSQLPDVREDIKKLENGPAVGLPIQIRLSGKELDTIYKLRGKIVKILSSTAGIYNIHDSWGAWEAQVTIEQDKLRAGKAGLKTDEIAASLSSQFSGITATTMLEGDERIPVIIRSAQQFRGDISQVESLNVYSSQTDSSVPLGQVADVSLSWAPSNILRRNTVRTMTIKSGVLDRFPAEVLAEIRPKIEALMQSDDWVPGYTIEYGGEQEENSKAQASIAAGMPLAGALLMLVLIYQFNSVIKILIILLTIPPMLIGITPGLIITYAPFGFMALLGMISLAGIIVNNALLLLEQIGIEQAAGKSVHESILASAKSRLRPIVMTTATTIVGLVPLSLSGGEMWRPMANTMMFGLGFATVLTLVLCPVLFRLFFRDEEDKG